MVMRNLDPNALGIKEEGWSAEDRARNLLDMWNDHSSKEKPWEYNQFVKKIFPLSGTHDFVEGFMLATLFMAEVISGGKVRDHIRKRDAMGDLDGLMLQRFLDWVDKEKEVQK
jgi:hypothetical protein